MSIQNDKAVLMYLNHYDLKNKPFNISPDPNFLWLGEKHAEALAGLQYGILENKGFVLLTGEIGAGKTLLINSLVKSINEEIIAAIIPDPRLELIDFYNILANKFKMDRRFERKGDFLIHFEEFLIKANGHGKKVLLVIDETQRIKSELLDEIRVLSNIEFENRKLINIFFVGQRELKELLLEERNRPLKQRITYNYHLLPLVEQETAAFIEHRLKVAGATRKIFSQEAIRKIHNFSQGVPRLINIICDHSLMTGYSNALAVIDVDVVNECAEELQISVEKSLPSSEQPTAMKDDPLVQERKVIKYVQKPEPSEKPYNEVLKADDAAKNSKLSPILKVAGIIAIIIIFFGMATAFFYNQRFEESDNRLKQNNEVLKSEDAVKDSKSPLMIANSKGDTQDTLPDKFSTDRAEIDENIEEIILPKELSVNEIEEFKEYTASNNEVPEVDLPRKESSEGRNLIVNDLKKPTVKEVDQSAKPTGGEKFLSFSEHKILIHFKQNSADLDSQAFEKLNKIVEIVSKSPDSEIIIEGYADSNGNYNFNKKLSQFRCTTVESYLAAKGIANSSIAAVGFGSDRPVGDNKTWEGRRKNRRVEIKVKIRSNGDS